MRLMNKELAESLEKYPLYSQDGKKADSVVVAKYFFLQPLLLGTLPRAERKMMTTCSSDWW